MTTALVYFAPVAWDSYLQRPHYLVRHYLESGGTRVIWIDPYPTRFPTLNDLRSRIAGTSLVTPRPDAVSVVAPRALPIEPLAAGRTVNRRLFGQRLLARLASDLAGAQVTVGIGRPSSLACDALEHLQPHRSFFDALDDFPAFYRGAASRAVADIEQRIAMNVDVVLTTSTGLWKKFEGVGERRMMVHNACDVESFPAPVGPVPGVVLGFVGCISTWFDWGLVDRLARAVPDAKVEIIGPCFVPPPTRLAPNVTLSPACPHEEAIARMASFSVGLIPFSRGRLTDGVDPIKYYEYRALGLPVLSTRFGEMAGRGSEPGVFFAEDADGLAEALRAAAAAPEPAASVEAFRRAHGWRRRFADAGLFAATSGGV